MAIRDQLRQEAIEYNQKSQQKAKDKKSKSEWLEFTTTYNLPYDASLQDEEVADLYKQWQANRQASPSPVNKDASKKNKELSSGNRSKYMYIGADGKAVGKSAYDEKGNLIGQYDPDSIRRDIGGTPTYLMNRQADVKPISEQEQQFRADMKQHEKQVASQVARERGPMPWEKPQNNPAPSRKGTRENPYTTNTEVKSAKVGEWCIHKGKPYQLRQVDIDWANGKRPAATKPANVQPENKPANVQPENKPANVQPENKQIIQLKRTNDWRTLYKLRRAGVPVVDKGDFYETDRAIYMKPRKKDGSVVTSINSTKARKKHYVENQDGEGNWVEYTEDEMRQRGKDAEDAVIKARSRTPLQTIVPRGVRVDTNSTGINPNVLAGVTAGEIGRG
jgi:hypothetical protein